LRERLGSEPTPFGPLPPRKRWARRASYLRALRANSERRCLARLEIGSLSDIGYFDDLAGHGGVADICALAAPRLVLHRVVGEPREVLRRAAGLRAKTHQIPVAHVNGRVRFAAERASLLSKSRAPSEYVVRPTRQASCADRAADPLR
jgi:hypothetical protein